VGVRVRGRGTGCWRKLDGGISWRYLGIKQAGVGSGFEPVGGGISRSKMGWDGDKPCGHTEGRVEVFDALDAWVGYLRAGVLGALGEFGDLVTTKFTEDAENTEMLFGAESVFWLPWADFAGLGRYRMRLLLGSLRSGLVTRSRDVRSLKVIWHVSGKNQGRNERW